jgi:hypothetical protein
MGSAAMAEAKETQSQKTNYVPTAEEREALTKVAARKTTPAPRLYVNEDGAVEIDHPDVDTAYKLLENALGTSDLFFTHGMLTQLIAACQRGGKVSEFNVNFLLSVIKGIEPRDQLEAMLAAQMAVIQITLFENRKILQGIEYVAQRDDAAMTMSKLARTFMMQMDALKRYRSKGEQNVMVQNVTVSDGGQAIVGDVHQEAKAADTPASPHPPALSYSEERPMEPIVG